MKNQRLRALIGAGLLTVSMAFGNIAHAATKYAKTTENLNFRTGPSTSKKVISTIKKNTQVEVISYEGKWAKIKYKDKVGYSSKEYLKEVSSSSNSNSGTSTSSSKKTGTVTADALNVRSGAGTSYSKIGSLKKGAKVTILSTSKGWHKIEMSGGKTGWVSDDYIKITSSGSSNNNNNNDESNTGSTNKKTGTVTADTLNVRSGAGTSYSKVGSLKKGAKVTILSTSKGWHKIEMSGGKTGWVSADYIKITTSGNDSNNNNNESDNNSGSESKPVEKKTGTVTADTLNVRKGAGTSYDKIGTLKKGAKVTILSTSKGWHKIEMSGGKTGWVSADYIKITTSGNNSNDNGSDNNSGSESKPVEKKTGTVTADALNVRKGAGTNYDKIGTLKKGDKVTILETSKGWHKIEMSGGKTGWVSADYIKITTSGEDSNDNDDNNQGQKPLPKPTSTPSYVDAPVNSAVMNSKYDEYQGLLTIEADINSGLKSLAVKVNEEFGVEADVEYEVYANGSWEKASNGEVASNSNKAIEGVRIKLNNAPSDYHVFYRVKVANQGWQNWVKDGSISGEIQNGKTIEDIEIRVIVDDNVNGMVKDTIAVDLGHNVPRPVVKGAVNGIYDEDYLIREVTEKVVYKLRTLGYNVVETKPAGYHSQSDELKVRTQIANANEADQFVSIHFNSGPKGSNGTEVLYSNPSSSKARAERVSKNISEAFGFKNRGAKQRTDLYVLNNTKMPAILVEGCFLDDIDMNKFIAKGSSAYEKMADAIVNGAIQ